MLMRVPDFAGSITHDFGLGVSAAGGGKFSVSFVGQTVEHIHASEARNADQEDRVHVFNAPFLRTGFAKTQDRLKLVLFNAQLIPPTPLLGALETGKPVYLDGGPAGSNGRRLSGFDGLGRAADGANAFAASEQRAPEQNALSEVLAPALSEPHRRRLGGSNCLDLNLQLIDIGQFSIDEGNEVFR